ncbi:5-methyltetrahydropteroyltriglutamate--homocysteine S-methyltransferase [Eubacterium xylanophilum]|uniref:5-methyltetrahydropteroyltriglutamate-- homocysteine S-methyltransferase n=1 Tax=Eubacterium xylanophilum TaxID=39497 RepID=UPI00047CD05E|nr:5-methyltetrahydropteroyltriglutamate--homocysteine S-methyltransferase [Eubacterium xylanophilum]
MQTSIIGYPRIGNLRELKFASEKYFRGEVSAEELEKTAKEIRQYNLKIQRESGLDFIPSNDFSFYDGVLDTAFMLGVVPKRYKDLKLSKLDTYFAAARGYQGANGDVKALAMKKWYNTNYHYLVPEFDDDVIVKLEDTKPLDLFGEAKEVGVTTKCVVVGPFSFLKLAKYTGKKTLEDYVDSVADAYIKLIEKYSAIGGEWLQIDEPSLVLDLDAEDIELFEKLYKKILASKASVKVLLQTYFGDVRDCYENIIGLDFDGVGLDFVEGKKSLELVKKHKFPDSKVLFAGVVNGKNIWKNNYQCTLNKLDEIGECAKNVVISTSCSLLHVPCTLKNETKLEENYTRYFAFAEEKLQEIADLKSILGADSRETVSTYIENVELFEKERFVENQEIKARIAALTEEDFVRKPAFDEREKIQKERLGLPVFPTTTIGSFPQTKDVKAKRTALRKGEISLEDYEGFVKHKIAECVKIQEDIGLDVLVHGEFERNDMVEYFGEQLQGYVFTEKAWVQSYGTRCVKPPIVWGDVSRKDAMTVKWSSYAQRLTDKPMKGMLTGPVTILNWSFPREDISLKESAFQIACAIREEVLDLEAAGISIIQVDEAALREKLPLRKSDWNEDYLDWAIPAFRYVHTGVKPETQIHTHMCYSEFADIIGAIDDMDADVITFEASRSDLSILEVLKASNFRTEVGPGVYDIHSPRIPSKDEILEAVDKMRENVETSKLWLNPDCGLKTRGYEETIPSLKNMVLAAKEVRADI